MPAATHYNCSVLMAPHSFHWSGNVPSRPFTAILRSVSRFMFDQDSGRDPTRLLFDRLMVSTFDQDRPNSGGRVPLSWLLLA